MPSDGAAAAPARPPLDDALILGFDTSGPWLRAALCRGNDIAASCDIPMPKGQGEALMPALEALLAGAGHVWKDLAALAVGTGPGNFTGTRIAVAAARGLALGLGIPAIGVDRFDGAALGTAPGTPIAVPALRGSFWLREAGAGPVQTGSLPPGTITDDTAPVPLAVAIARIAASRLGEPQPRPAPLYLRDADAAPPSEAPPALIG